MNPAVPNYLFRVFLIGLVLLCSCNSNLFHQQKAKPYYFSHQKKSAYSFPEKTPRPATPKSPETETLLSDGFTAPDKPPRAADYIPQKNPAQTKTKVTAAPELKPKQENNPPSSYGLGQDKKSPQTAPKKTSDWGFLGLAGLVSVVCALGLSLFIPRAKNLASWAAQNRKQAWLLTGLGHVLSSVTGFLAGSALFEAGFQTSAFSTAALAGAAAAAVLIYPSGNTPGNWLPASFRTKKLLMLVLVQSGFFLFVNMGNRHTADAAFTPLAARIEAQTQLGPTLTKPITGAISFITQPASPEKTADGKAVALTLLALVLMFVLQAVVAVVSCNLTCSGQSQAGALVLILGNVLLVGGFALALVAIIRASKRRTAKKKAAAPPATAPGEQKL